MTRDGDIGPRSSIRRPYLDFINLFLILLRFQGGRRT
jgi:FtsH-binding integral membrane protein